MRLPTFIAYAIATVAIVDLVGMPFGGVPHRFAVPVQALFGLAVAVDRRARIPGIVSAASWVGVAVLSYANAKFMGPFACAGAGGLAIAVSSLLAPKLARGLLVPLAFVAFAWFGSATRQIAFELSSQGFISGRLDGCTIALGPIFLIALLVLEVGVACIVAVIGANGLRVFALSPAVEAQVRRHGFAVTCALAALAGLGFGASSWRDWQISQPCL